MAMYNCKMLCNCNAYGENRIFLGGGGLYTSSAIIFKLLVSPRSDSKVSIPSAYVAMAGQ
jgi:hypothetical protein